ncbi:putative quinol monooxygenase [Methylobacterium gossipiicola]|uniref:putative quinol monooxygenase n=1 Tax=Methylobacterium gossipiicola TaxID=582675 RepID=UPI000B8A0B74|nr:antibiotic biosynthesis monooxygenase family protein [Methylobacterium gossipiicola]
MIIVSGIIMLSPGQRGAFLALTHEVISVAREARGCRSFVVVADPIEPNVVVVYEEWDTESDLLRFRGEGPSPDIKSMIIKADVQLHHVASSKPA